MTGRRSTRGRLAGVAVVAVAALLTFAGCETGPAVSTTRLNVGTVGAAYRTNLAASGGKAPYAYSATGLPVGLRVSGAQLAGTATTSGTYTVVVKAKDANGVTSAGRSIKLAVQSSLEQQLFDLVNAQRRANGKANLATYTDPQVKAHAHSQTMARAGAISHTDPNAGQPACATAKGENVAVGGSVSGVVTAWMGSSVHRGNILGTFTRMGVGVTVANGKTWAVLVFVSGC